MTAEVEKKWELIKRGPVTEDMEGGLHTDTQRHLVYDEMKPKYAERFRFPKHHDFQLTPKDLKKGEYKRFFVQFDDELTEVSDAAFKYYKKNSTAYHGGIIHNEYKGKLDVMAVDQNRMAINEIANNGEMPKILNILSPTDFMEIKEWLYTDGDQLEFENGDGYVGEYHIHPQQGPMVGPVHTNQKHAYLYWSEKQRYVPKGLV